MAMSVTVRDSIVSNMLEKLESTRTAPYRSHATLLTGPKGVGKSLLIARLVQRAQKKKISVVEVHCSSNDDRPHGPIIDCLHGLVECSQKPLEQLPSVHRALTRLSGLSPQVNRSGIKDSSSKGYLAESIRQALLELSNCNHMCIIVHDVHRTEPTTADISAYLLEDLLADSVFEWSNLEDAGNDIAPRHGAFVLFSFRTVERMGRLRTLAATTESIEILTLKPLDLAGVKQFLSDDEVASAFLRKSQGMPLSLAQLIAAMPDDPEAYWFDRSAEFPAGLTQRLNMLAIAGEPLTPRQLDDLVDDAQSSFELLSSVPDLVQSNLVHGRPTFGFAHTSEKETWHERMDGEVAKALHGQLAERMAAGLYGEPQTIARHFLGAQRPEDAIPFIMETVPHLRRAHAFTRAAHLLQAIVHTADGTLQADIMMTLIDCYIAMGQYDDARHTLKELKTHSITNSDAVFMTELSLIVQAEDAQAVSAMEQRLDQVQEECYRSKARALLAEFFLRDGNLDKAFELSSSPEDISTPDDAHALDLRNTLGKVHLYREAFDEAESVFSANLESARLSNDGQHQAKALINLGVVFLQQGFVNKALLQFETVKDHCTHEGDIPHLAVALENLAVLHYRRQSFKQALFFYHRSAATSRRLGRNAQFSTTILNLGDLYLTVGDVQKATRLADIARSYMERGKYRFLEPQLLTLEGDIAAHRESYEASAEFYERAESLIRAGSLSNQRLIPLLRAESELHLDHGQLDKATQKLDEALSLVPSMHEGLALRLRITHGAILSERGMLQEAEQELEAAVHGATESDDIEALWLALSRLGFVKWRLGDTDAAKSIFQGANKETLRVVANLPSRFRPLYKQSPNQKRLQQHIDRLAAGLTPTNTLITRHSPSPKTPFTSEPFDEKWALRYPKLIGHADPLANVFRILDRVAGSEGMMLICGESGTGKELVAEALHQQSPRNGGPFVKVNCAAFVETLLLSELFGHEKGAFTGASTSKKGRFELADGGTLFLDEIGDISPNTQVALLRVLQEGTLDRVGGSETISVDVRVICATHRNLDKMVEDGSFRMDLYYRLRGLTIDLPPLRDRKSDIPILTQHFLALHKSKNSADRISQASMASLIQHEWPGNVRELENVIRSAALFAASEQIEISDLVELGNVFEQPTMEASALVSKWFSQSPKLFTAAPSESQDALQDSFPTTVSGDETDDSLSATNASNLEGADLLALVSDSGGLVELKKRLEFEAIAYTLKITKGNITKAAKRLGMKRPRLSQIISANETLIALKEESLE
jgi:transcriptional regulator with GAF, ATPase, and Fis domain/tetratricopeptide (TPR) repeat protein